MILTGQDDPAQDLGTRDVSGPDRTPQDQAYVGMRRLAALVGSGTRPLPETLDALVRCAVEATGAVAGAMYLLTADRSLRLTASHGGPAGAPDAAHTALSARTTILSCDSAWVCVPLLTAVAELGVLCCHRRHESRPGELELAYLSLVAAQASSAVDQARARAAETDEAALSERRRLARELHDSVSQSLYSIGLGARTARELLRRDPGLAGQPIDYVLQLAQTGLAEMHALLFEPAPDGLADGLVAALEQQIAAMGARHAVATDAALGPEPAAPGEVKQALYRIALEALRNIARHARAHHVTARLAQTSTDLVLEIADDGVGFDAAASFPGHLGLASMHQRIAAVGGDLDISSTPGGGTRIRVRAPMRQ
jgi:signal transduction histidine kinase